MIEAFQYDGDFVGRNGSPYVPDWAFSAFNDGIMYYENDGELWIKTLEGDHHASIGDFIIQGVQGEFYPCKPDIFAKTYELVGE